MTASEQDFALAENVGTVPHLQLATRNDHLFSPPFPRLACTSDHCLRKALAGIGATLAKVI